MGGTPNISQRLLFDLASSFLSFFTMIQYATASTAFNDIDTPYKKLSKKPCVVQLAVVPTQPQSPTLSGTAIC